MRRSKQIALGLLAAVSFFGPFLEVSITGGVEPLGRWELAETFVALALIFWWYHVDKAEHGYRAGPLMNGGMLLAVIVTMPIYFIRSRGWKRGSISIVKGVAVVAGVTLLGMLGESIGKALSS